MTWIFRIFGLFFGGTLKSYALMAAVLAALGGVGGGILYVKGLRVDNVALAQAVRDRDAVIAALRKNMKDLVRDQINDKTIDDIPGDGLVDFGRRWLRETGPAEGTPARP